MRSLLATIILLAMRNVVFGESLHFYVLPDDAAAPTDRSSLRAFQKHTPNLGSSVLDVEVLADVRLTTTHGESAMYDSQGNITEKWSTEGVAIVVKWPDGLANKFAKLTGEYIGHQILIALGDRILMTPRVNEPIETDSFQITLGKATTAEEAKQIVDSLKAMVVKEASHSTQATAPRHLRLSDETRSSMVSEFTWLRASGQAVVIEEPSSKKFVQFGWKTLMVDLPSQTLSRDEAQRAERVMARFDIPKDTYPIGTPNNQVFQTSFQKHLGDDVALAVSVSEAVFREIYLFPADVRLKFIRIE